MLQVLAGTESGLSASQVARLAPRGTRAGQLPVLNRLVEHGLVIADPSNRGFLYRLSRDHVLADAVLMAARARTTLLRRMADAAAAMRPEPVHVSVFGSFVRGEAGPASDIDVLIVTQPEGVQDDGSMDHVRTLADRVLAWTGNRMEHVTLTVERLRDLAAAGEPIVATWLDEAFVLHGTALNALVHPLAPTGSGLR